MPLATPLLTLDLISAGVAQGMMGSSYPLLSDAISSAMGIFMLIPGTVTATLVGVSGPGVVTSAGPLIGPEPISMSTALSGAMVTNGMAGPGVPQLALAVSLALCKNLPLLAVAGVCPTVSTGAGVAKVVGLQQTALYGLLMQQATMRGMLGSELARTMNGLATGICTYLNAVATIPVICSGPPVPPPPAGPLPMSGPATLTLI